MSVIIPTYNRAHYICEAVESVLAQTYKNVEIIVVDDGSTDGTEEVLSLYRGRIRYFYQENRGPSAARNAGIQKSTGPYIAFLDSDDLWMPDKLDLQVRYLSEHPDYGLVHTDHEDWIVRDGAVVEVRPDHYDSHHIGYIFPEMFLRNEVSTPTVLLRKVCLNKVGYFDENLLLFEDHDLWLRIARYYKIGYINKKLAVFRRHGDNITDSCSRSKAAILRTQMLQNFTMNYPEIIEEIGRRRVKLSFSESLFCYAYECFDTGDFRNARKFMQKAISYCPTRWSCYLYYLATLFPQTTIRRLRKLKRAIQLPRKSAAVRQN